MDNTNYSKNQSNCEYKHGLLQQQLFYGNIAALKKKRKKLLQLLQNFKVLQKVFFFGAAEI